MSAETLLDPMHSIPQGRAAVQPQLAFDIAEPAGDLVDTPLKGAEPREDSRPSRHARPCLGAAPVIEERVDAAQQADGPAQRRD